MGTSHEFSPDPDGDGIHLIAIACKEFMFILKRRGQRGAEGRTESIETAMDERERKQKNRS